MPTRVRVGTRGPEPAFPAAGNALCVPVRILRSCGIGFRLPLAWGVAAATAPAPLSAATVAAVPAMATVHDQMQEHEKDL